MNQLIWITKGEKYHQKVFYLSSIVMFLTVIGNLFWNNYQQQVALFTQGE